MKLLYGLSIVAIAGAMALSGCKKAESTPPAAEINGVKVDSTKFSQAFATANPDVQRIVNNVVMTIRYSQFEQALMGLDKLTGDASLTEPQKKIVNDLIAQLKEVINKAPQPGK